MATKLSIFKFRVLIVLSAIVLLAAALTPEEKELEKARAKAAVRKEIEKSEAAKAITIKLQSVVECAPEDIELNGCSNPVKVYPTHPRYIEWAFDKQYTVTWGNADDEYPQQF